MKSWIIEFNKYLLRGMFFGFTFGMMFIVLYEINKQLSVVCVRFDQATEKCLETKSRN